MKIIDKITTYMEKKEPFYSFEFFPPKTESGLSNLYARLDRMAPLSPTFIDMTWGAGGSVNNQLSFEISKTAQSYFGYDVMMHMTCTEMPIERINETLEKVYTSGIRNLLALRGDPPQGGKDWQRCESGFSYASDLTAHIKKKYGDYFGIGVAGYPEGHLESPSKAVCVDHLKYKVDQGGDFIITQLFYDLDEFFEFENLCRQAGITCPIIPGLLPIQNYQRFRRFTEFCQTKVPKKILTDLENIKTDDAAVQSYGIELCADMCRKLLKHGTPGLHFYTLNLETSIISILKALDFVKDGTSHRVLPWRQSTLDKRREETVRPIFWSNRPKSYLARTMNWDDFPNGRWGDSRSPTFGNLNDYYLLRKGIGLEKLKEERLKMWGKPESLSDVSEIFSQFCLSKINDLPWCEMPIHSETLQISLQLVDLNLSGLLTINSQPQINGAPSEDSEVGWGGPGGTVFQKAYIEFFLHQDKLLALTKALADHPSLTYQAVNLKGDQMSYPNHPSVNAVTWGVFPGKEVQQPTIVDPESFLIWKDEAFNLWITDWANLYQEDSKSQRLITEIAHTHYLVNIVENDFINGDIFRFFRKDLFRKECTK